MRLEVENRVWSLVVVNRETTEPSITYKAREFEGFMALRSLSLCTLWVTAQIMGARYPLPPQNRLSMES